MVATLLRKSRIFTTLHGLQARAGQAVGMHPHSGIATLTYLIEVVTSGASWRYSRTSTNCPLAQAVARAGLTKNTVPGRTALLEPSQTRLAGCPSRKPGFNS